MGLLLRADTGFLFNAIRRVSTTVVAPPSSPVDVGSADPRKQPAVPYEAARPYVEIPCHPFLQILYTQWRYPHMRKYHHMFADLFDRYGDIVRFRIPGAGDHVFICHPEDIKILLAGDGKMPIEPGFDFFVHYRQRLRRDLYPGGGGLLGSHGEQWYEVRTAVQQDMLRPKSALFYMADIGQISSDLADLIDHQMCNNGGGGSGEIADVTPLMYRWALEATGAIFLDSRLGCLEPNLAKDSDAQVLIDCVDLALGDALRQLVSGIPWHKYFRTKPLRIFDEASERIHKISKEIIEKAIARSKEVARTDEAEMSVLEKMIKSCGPDSPIPLVMAMDALMAGIDTTGNQMAFMLYHLAANPKQQEILAKEVRDVVGMKGEVTESSLNKMKYLKAFQHESQRLLPAAGGLNRLTQVPLVLAGFQIPPRTRVGVPGIVNQLAERHYPRAKEFAPERWLRGCPAHHKAHPFAHIPFSHGPRMCIGRRFAELEVQVATVRLLQRFRLEDPTDQPLDMVTHFTNRPDGPVRIRFRPRD